MQTTTNRLDATVADVLVESHVTLTEAMRIVDDLGLPNLESIRHKRLGSLKASQLRTLAISLHRSADEIIHEA